MANKRLPLFVGVDTVISDLGVSRAKAYEVIRQLNKEMKEQNPRAIVVAGKVNRIWYEEGNIGLYEIEEEKEEVFQAVEVNRFKMQGKISVCVFLPAPIVIQNPDVCQKLLALLIIQLQNEKRSRKNCCAANNFGGKPEAPPFKGRLIETDLFMEHICRIIDNKRCSDMNNPSIAGDNGFTACYHDNFISVMRVAALPGKKVA